MALSKVGIIFYLFIYFFKPGIIFFSMKVCTRIVRKLRDQLLGISQENEVHSQDKSFQCHN